jgi:hypothetical protein
MGALLRRYAADGVRIDAADDGNLRVTGQLTDTLRASIRSNKPALLAELAANSEPYAHARARLWRIRYPNVATMDVLFTPEATAEEVSAVYLGAAIEAIPEVTKRKPTAAEVEELRTLIAEVLRDDSEAERAEAFAIARADPDAALLALRALRDELRLNEKWLGRRYAHARQEARESDER